MSDPQFETLWSNLVLRNGWSVLGESWPCCAVSSWAFGKPNIQNHSFLWICVPVNWCVWNLKQQNMCPQTEWMIARTKIEISFINYLWWFKWKISYNFRAESNLNKRLLRSSVNTSLSLTNAISFIITVTKIVASAHELWQLANQLSWVKKTSECYDL